MEKFKFEPKKPSEKMIGGIRVTPEVFKKLHGIASKNKNSVQELIRQMIDFSLKNMSED